MKKDFPVAKIFVCSCCNPSAAREIIGKNSEVIILGSSFNQKQKGYSTFMNNEKREIRVVPYN